MDFIGAKDLFLAIDQGGHASRALVFDIEGNLRAAAYHDLHPQVRDDARVEYEPGPLLASLHDVVAAVLDKLGDERRHVVRAGLATQRANVMCWDRLTGRAIGPVISWQDRRGRKQVASLARHSKFVHARTGLFLSPHYGASKIHWCLEHIPEVLKALQDDRLGYGPMAAWLTWQLTHREPVVADVVNASRTQLLSLEQLNWDDALLELFDVPGEPLPRSVPNMREFGRLSQAHDVPLHLVTGDQAAALFAYGELQPDTAYINTGTGAFVSRPSGPARLYGRRLLTSVIHHTDERTEYVLEGTVNGAGAALEWFARRFDVPDLVQRLPAWLAETVGSPTLFLNGVSGLGSPFWIADFPTRFEGPAELPLRAVAVVESIVFLLGANLAEMRKLASPPEQIQITGGLAHLDGLCQRLADLSGLPVYRPKECEATARGLAFLLAGRPRHWPEETPGDWFQPKPCPPLQATYHRWLAAMLGTMRKSSGEGRGTRDE